LEHRPLSQPTSIHSSRRPPSGQPPAGVLLSKPPSSLEFFHAPLAIANPTVRRVLLPGLCPDLRRRRLIAWASRDETNAVDDEAKSSGRRQTGETDSRQSTTGDQTTEFDHGRHNELHFPNLLPKLPGPNPSAGLTAPPSYCVSRNPIYRNKICSRNQRTRMTCRQSGAELSISVPAIWFNGLWRSPRDER
jgi:hypothetical protein